MQKPLRPCKQPGCPELTRDGYCPKHKHTQQPKRDDRPSAHDRGYTYRWTKASKAFLRAHPWCAECDRRGRRAPATVVDHIIPHKGDRALFWDRQNWQPMCKQCHDRKTATEDGGFGRPTPPVNKV